MVEIASRTGRNAHHHGATKIGSTRLFPTARSGHPLNHRNNGGACSAPGAGQDGGSKAVDRSRDSQADPHR